MVTVKDIYVLGNQNILNKGENDFVIQGGRGNDEKKNQYLAKYKYGLTENLTTTIGTSFLENRDSIKYEVLEGGLAYRFGLEKYPTLISGTLLEELNSESQGFKGVLEQKLPWDSNLIVRYEDYNKEISDRLRKDYSYNIDLSKSFRRFTSSIGYFNNTYEDENLYQIYLNLDYNISRNFRMSLSNEYYEYSSTDEISSNGYGTQIKLNYNGIRGVAAILEGKINYQEDKVADDEIKLSLVKSPSESGFFKNVDTTLEVGHSREKGGFFEIRFTLKKLSENFNVHIRTIRYDIDNINYILKSYKLDQIKKMDGGGLQVNLKSNDLNKIISDFGGMFSENRKSYLKLKVLSKQMINLTKEAEFLNVSRTTLKKDMLIIKSELEVKDVFIHEFASKGVSVIGEVQNIVDALEKEIHKVIDKQFVNLPNVLKD
ncbi:MAG: hypothetical protein ACRCW5_06090, partial [Cetobacterium sp.]|uniref:hypothetical protein n=1 Tax=Cetobacterium sp. TaxID=2071632 RepID=UPI003F31F583